MTLAATWLRRLLSATPSHQANVTTLNKWMFLLERDGIVPKGTLASVWYRHGPMYPDLEPAIQEEAKANRITERRVQHNADVEEHIIQLASAPMTDELTKKVEVALKAYTGLNANQLAKACYPDAPFLMQTAFRWTLLSQCEELVKATEKKSPAVGELSNAVLTSISNVIGLYPFEEAEHLVTLQRYLDGAAFASSTLLNGERTTVVHAKLVSKLYHELWELVACAIRLDTEEGNFAELRPAWRQQMRDWHKRVDAVLYTARTEAELMDSQAPAPKKGEPKSGTNLAHAYLKHNVKRN